MTTNEHKSTNPSANPGAKLRSIISASSDDANSPPPPLPRKELPKRSGSTVKSSPKRSPAARRALKVQIPFRRDRVAPAFWTIASIVSIFVNLVMLIVIIALVRELSALQQIQVKVVDEVLGGLHRNFVKMDQAHIVTAIDVEAQIPVVFDLPVVTNTTVVLTENVQITGARVSLNTGGLNILSAPTNIVLPAGTNLPIALNITIPVQTTIPITLNVPVDIPLADTDLHKPFVGLKDVVQPYHCLLDPDATLLLDDGTVFELCKDETTP